MWVAVYGFGSVRVFPKSGARGEHRPQESQRLTTQKRSRTDCLVDDEFGLRKLKRSSNIISWHIGARYGFCLKLMRPVFPLLASRRVFWRLEEWILGRFDIAIYPLYPAHFN